MDMIDTLTGALGRALDDHRRTRARRHLLARDARLLDDAGFSRELLERGNAAWPWRAETDAPTPVAAPAGRAALAPVVALDGRRPAAPDAGNGTGDAPELRRAA